MDLNCISGVVLRSLVGKIPPSKAILEFGLFIKKGHPDMAIPTYVFVSWNDGSKTLSIVPEQWKIICKTLSYL